MGHLLHVLSRQKTSVFTLSTIQTDITQTPSATKFIVPSGANAVCIYTGFRVRRDLAFFLYVKIGSAAVKKIRVYQCDRLMLTATPGETIAIGSDSEAIALTLCGMRTPANFTAPSGASGTANADDIHPQDWQPAQPHIVFSASLASDARQFKISTFGSRKDVFVKESPDGVNWSPIGWYIVDGYDINVTCAHRYIALGTLDGTAISITAPVGTQIGGVKQTYAIAFPAVTGTTYNISDGTDFVAKAAIAVAGDRLLLPDSTITLPNAAFQSSNWTANIAAGRKGPEGIILEGSGPNSAIKVGTAASCWTHSGQGGMTQPFWMRNFAFDYSQASDSWRWDAGMLRAENIVWRDSASSASGVGLVLMGTQLSQTNVSWLFHKCVAKDSKGDCWSAFGSSNSASKDIDAVYLKCQGTRPGTAFNDQCFTTHNYLDLTIIGGYFSELTGGGINIFANGGTTETNWCYWVKADAGASAVQITGWKNSNYYGCTRVWGTNENSSVGETPDWQCLFNRFNATTQQSSFAAVFAPTLSSRNVHVIEGNHISAGTGRGLFPNTNVNSLSYGPNLIDGANEAVRFNNITSGTGKTFAYLGLTILNSSSAFACGEPAAVMNLRGIACKANTNSINALATADAAEVNSDYGVYDANVDVDFSAGANDVTGADADLDSNYFPTSLGNCDATGSNANYNYIGGRDHHRFIHIYEETATPKGSRGRVRGNLLIKPDIYA